MQCCLNTGIKVHIFRHSLLEGAHRATLGCSHEKRECLRDKLSSCLVAVTVELLVCGKLLDTDPPTVMSERCLIFRQTFQTEFIGAHYHPASVADLTNVVVDEWEQIPAAMFQQLIENPPRKVEAALAEY